MGERPLSETALHRSADRRPSGGRRERRGLLLVGVFLLLDALALTLAPLTRGGSPRLGHWLGVATLFLLFAAAHWILRRDLPGHDPLLLPLAALLSGWGLLAIWRLYPSFGLRQTLWLLPAVGLLLLAGRLPADLGFLRRYKYLWLTSGLILTGLTLFFGVNPAGPGAPPLWLGCCGLYLQPSEPLKLLLIVYLAAYLASGRRGGGMLPPLGAALHADSLLPLLAPTLVMTGLALLLLVVQRDLGAASILFFLYAAIVYVTSGRKRVLLGGALGILTAALVGAQLFDVVRVRLEAWLNPWADPSGRSYQIVQSFLAVANGGIFGRGPGMGSPALVPVAHSDFIFATIGEEMGLVGSLGLLLALGLLTVRGLTIALHAPDPFRRYLAAGLTAALIGQSILIVGGNLRLLPLTGVTLPFVSYGGSSLVTSYLSLLLLLRISVVGEQRPAPLPRQRPYLQLGGALLLGLAAAGLAAGWWGVWRAPDLLTRTDNPRRTVADRLAQRGALLDRDNVPLVASEGAPGSFSRRLTQPSLSNILGYNDPTYGQTGLEASQDAYLRGLRGYPALETWWNHLLYGYPPAGLSLRLSLDADLQATAEALFPAERGALVLLNSASGEVLTMISRPEFDANTLAENWASLIADPGAPLVNRAVQAQYPSGALLGPFLLAEAQAQGVALPSAAALQAAADSAVCARPPAADLTLANLIAVGCPATAEALAASLGTSAVTALNQRLGLYDAPQIGLEVSAPDDTTRLDPTISPLQAAVAAAALAHDGMRPAPQLVTAVNLPDDGWTSLVTPLTAVPALNADAAAATAARLAVRNTPERTDLWATVVVVSQLAPDYTGPVDPATAWVTWFIGGSLPGSSFQPVALALVIEGRQPEAAYAAGLALLETARR